MTSEGENVILLIKYFYDARHGHVPGLGNHSPGNR